MRIKLFKKRLRITKNGKILRRSCNLGHTKAKDSSKVKRARKGPISMSTKHTKSIIKNSN
jgi:ribosomal protein L35